MPLCNADFTEDRVPPIARFASRCDNGDARHIESMKPLNPVSELFKRQAQLEEAMRKPGGARVIEERELLALREQLAQLRSRSG
jgi:hypothetical protein